MWNAMGINHEIMAASKEGPQKGSLILSSRTNPVISIIPQPVHSFHP